MRGLSPRGGSGFSRWTDAEHFVQVKEGKTLKVHAETGRAEPWEEASEDRGPLTEALSSLPTIGKETARGLAARATLDAKRSGAYVEHDADLYFASLDGRQARRLTSTPGREELVEFSPDGQFVSFVRDNDLHVVDVATGTERALTTGGSDRVRHGKADWVYFEELFNRSWKAYWWSPDSRHIAFLEIDDRHIPTHHVLIDTGDRRVVEETAYPRSGEPNPYVQLGIVPVGGGPVRHADLTGYTPDDFLISDVGWWPDGKHAYFYGQNRIQTWLDVLKLPVAGGKPQRLFRETTRAWVESLGPIHVLKDGTFLISSERDGWKHLYRYNADGSLQNRVTSGEWEVRGISHIDEDGGWVYLTGTRDNPIGLNLYRAKLDGSALERLTQGPGTHSAALSPEGGLLVDQYSGRETPPKAELRRTDGSAVRTLDAGDEASAAGPGDPSTPTREIVRIPTRDGFLLEGEVVLPANLDPSGKTLYPVWLMTYGGPHFPTIRDGWRGPGAGLGLEGTLVERGIIVFKVDPRSASGKGAASAWTAYRKLGVQELEDIKDALAWLKQRPYVDGSRIGLSGHSYGGYLTAFCMTHSDLFAAGIAGAPVTDWRDYDSIYTERYMSTPQDNPEGYKASSVVEAAANLHGKLLILHGAIDDNVSVRNTMRLVHALQQADKDFELMIYPSARHGIGGAHYSRIQRAFIERVIGGPKPKD
jgi:dipeptidyl-peptidase-4